MSTPSGSHQPDHRLKPKDPAQSLPHYRGVVRRWQVYTSLPVKKQAAYIVDNAFQLDNALQQRADRVWELYEEALLSENGVQKLFDCLLKDEEGLRLIDVALQWVVFHQVVGPQAKMARTANESVPEYLDRISHEMTLIKRAMPALVPNDTSAVLVALIGLQATPNDYTIIQNNYDFESLIHLKSGYTAGDGWAKFVKCVKDHLAPQMLVRQPMDLSNLAYGGYDDYGYHAGDDAAYFSDMLDSSLHDESLLSEYFDDLTEQDVLEACDEESQPADAASFVVFFNKHKSSFLRKMRDRFSPPYHKGAGKGRGKDKSFGKNKSAGKPRHLDHTAGKRGPTGNYHGKGRWKEDGKNSWRSSKQNAP